MLTNMKFGHVTEMLCLMLSVAFPLSSLEIFTHMRDSLEVLYVDLGIVFFWKTSTFFGMKADELFLPKHNRLRVRIENAIVSLRRLKKCCVVLCKPSKLYTVRNVMSLAKMPFQSSPITCPSSVL